MNGDADLIALAILTLRDSILLLIQSAQATDPELLTDDEKKQRAMLGQIAEQREMTLINVINQRQQQMARNEMAAVLTPPKIARP